MDLERDFQAFDVNEGLKELEDFVYNYGEAFALAEVLPSFSFLLDH